jgi:RNA 3'-terminal phosphate cyclase (ATP)
VELHPAAPRGGDFHFDVGTAGSATLVLQTVLPALLMAPEPSTVGLVGGTHNPLAPPFEFLARSYLSALGRAGARVEVELVRPGFYPAGGGELLARIAPAGRLSPFELLERGELRARRAQAIVARLDPSIAERELAVVRRRLGWRSDEVFVTVAEGSRGPGNALVLEMEHEAGCEVVTAFGAPGKPAETVALEAVDGARRFLESGAAVGEHLADQLLLPLALAGGGAFLSAGVTEHARTNAEVIETFLPVRVTFSEEGRAWRVDLRPVPA